jgi:hypothetical protein
MRRLIFSNIPATILFTFLLTFGSISGIAQDKSFNVYLLRAVDSIEKNWALKGYNIESAFTHDLKNWAGNIESVITINYDVRSCAIGNYCDSIKYLLPGNKRLQFFQLFTN